jgi:hypothetical protein
MKPVFFLLLLTSFMGSCKQSTPDEPEKPELNFSIDTIYQVSDLWQHKSAIGCSEKPYWQGKTIKLQGYFGNTDIGGIYRQGQANTPDALYDYINFQRSAHLNFAVADSANIRKKIIANPRKNCVIKLTCSSMSFPMNNSCDQVIDFTIEKAEDIVIK